MVTVDEGIAEVGKRYACTVRKEQCDVQFELVARPVVVVYLLHLTNDVVVCCVLCDGYVVLLQRGFIDCQPCQHLLQGCLLWTV